MIIDQSLADIMKKGSGIQIIVGIIILIIGIGVGLALNNVLITYLATVTAIAVIISSFLIIIKQYDRAIMLRLGKYEKRVGPGVRFRIPFVDSILVEKVRGAPLATCGGALECCCEENENGTCPSQCINQGDSYNYQATLTSGRQMI